MLFVFVVALIGGVISIRELTRVRNAIITMQESSTHVEMAWAAAYQTAELVTYIREGVTQGLSGPELNRLVAPSLITLEVQRQALRVEAARLPTGSDIQARMGTVGTVLGNVSGVSWQILQAVERGDPAWARYQLAQLEVNHRLVRQESETLVSLARKRHAQALADARQAARRVFAVITMAVLAVTLAAAGAASLALRGVMTGLSLLSTSAERLAAGHLEERIPIRGVEEFRSLARAFNNMASELQGLYTGLERLVAQRTEELARRTAQLEAAATVARRAAEIRDMNALLNEMVALIAERFGFYHVGIFLVDEAGEYAVLRAASSEGGQRMLARGHRLAVGRVGIVGYVAGTGQPRIALDVGTDAVFFDNPDLPLTRSEIALPLKVGEQVLGVLDIQSEKPAAFTREDVAVLQTMADQIALAMENARLLEESRRTLEELRSLYGERVRETWERLEDLPPALVYDRVAVMPAETLPSTPVLEEALRRGQVVALSEPDNGRAVIAAPLRLHDEVIGAIALEEAGEARIWTEDEIALVQAVSEQVALALESARLYQMEQRRRFIADTLQEIARVVGSTLDPEEVTERLLDRLGRLIPYDVAVIHLLVGEQREIIGGRGMDLEVMRRWLEKQPPVSQDPLLAEVLNTGIPALIADTRMDPRWKRSGARSAMAIPMVLGEEVIGFLLMDHHQPNMYDDETVALATAVASQAAVAIQNARLYSEAQERAMEQEGLARIAALAVSTLELEPLLEGVLQEALPLLESESAVLFMYDEDTRTLQARLVLHRGEFLRETRGWEVPIDAPGMEQSIFVRGGAYYSNLGPADPNLIPVYLPYLERLDVRNFCGVALRVRDQSIGELYFVNRRRGFGHNEIRLARAVAGYIANALANARLFAEARLRAEELAILNELGQALTARLEVEQVLEEAYRGASRLLDATNFYIALWDPQQEVVSFPLVVEENQRHPPRTRPFARGMTEYIIQNRKPVLIEEDVPARLQEMGVEPIGRMAQSWLGVPLIVGEQVLGVMAVQSYTTPRAYDRHDLDLLTAVASQVAIALQNARSYEEAQRRAERERIIREVTARIWASPDLDTVLQTTARELGKVLGTSHTVVRLGGG
ncbi:MAG: GAF domain-containing protein [Anaerolineae bacterium]|nr:GAF domain-containing protein [Anaerolineae bacterium]MDW8068622.1 GAF domain-containing protein [Anaerolineae bacterium]